MPQEACPAPREDLPPQGRTAPDTLPLTQEGAARATLPTGACFKV